MVILPFLPLIEKALDLILPDPQKAMEAKTRLAELAQKGELAILDAEVKLATGQMTINAEEAKSSSLFVSGWRPAVGWTCVTGLIYTFLVHPLLTWLSINFGIIAPPTIEAGVLTTLLTGMLGLAGIRSFEKYNGVAKK
jgi:hypothetical protein